MKQITIRTVVALATLLSLQAATAQQAPAQAAAGRGAAAARPVSPEIHADRTVTFRLAAPKATGYYPKIGMTQFEYCFYIDKVEELK